MKQWNCGPYFFMIEEAQLFVKLPSDDSYRKGANLSLKEISGGKLDALISRAFNAGVLSELKKSIEQSRENLFEKGANTLRYTPPKIIIGESDCLGGIGTSATAVSFLEGAHHAFVLQHFGQEVLKEALEIAQRLAKTF